MPFKNAYVRARIRIPQADGVVPKPPTTSEGAAIRTERHASDIVSMPSEGAYGCARHRIPQTDGLIITPDPLAIVRPSGLNATLVT